LAGDFKAELVQPAERGHVRASEAALRGSVVHVEVFQMGSVRTSISGRPRLLSGDRRATRIYTLICEEPDWAAVASSEAVESSRVVYER
jgi:hypothetical protein